MSKYNPYIFTFILWCIYVYLTFSTPQTETSKNIFDLRLTFALPYLLIWQISVYGWVKINDYAKSIKQNADGRALMGIANGLHYLIAGIIITALVGALRSYYIEFESAKVFATVFINYLHTILPLIGFFLIFEGSGKLMSSIKEKTTMGNRVILIFPIIMLSIVYTWLTFTNPNRQIVPNIDTSASYYLPDILIGLTIVIPAIFGWFFGALSVVQITNYKQKVKGIIYREFFQRFVYGLIGVVFASIILQALLFLGSSRLIAIGIGPLLAIIYVFIFIQAIGFGFIAQGAKQLNKIEI